MSDSSSFNEKNSDNSSNERTMYEAVCDKCHADILIPFKPTPGREIFCKACLRKQREKKAHSQAKNPSGQRQHQGHSGKSYEITCSHCGKKDTVPFEPFEGSIVLCSDCMNNPNVTRHGARILHSIICSVCGKESKVPFKPDEGSRVLCRQCHIEEREKKAHAREHFAKTHPSVVHGTRVRIDIRCDRCGCEDSLPYVPKTDGPILCRQCAENTFGEDWADKHHIRSHEFSFYCARCGRQDFVPFRPKASQNLLCKHCLNDQAVLRDNSGSPKKRIEPNLYIRHKDDHEDQDK